MLPYPGPLPRELMYPPLPEANPLPHERQTGDCCLTVTAVEGPSLMLWSGGEFPCEETAGEWTLQLQPDQSIVIGRQEGGPLEYLDPRYQPTRIVPGSRKPVVANGRDLSERTVSRGHFMLKGSAAGIVLRNGVPRRGGGVRPPLNGTFLIEPQARWLINGEEYLIERGAAARIGLPNGTILLLQAG